MKGDQIEASLRHPNRCMGQLPLWTANHPMLVQRNALPETLPNALLKLSEAEKPKDMECQGPALFQLLHRGNAM